ncbi:hypothetical protein [Dactylosporangium darangshiense]|uniref:hypothetical protein n=1 Tax=Dactylosporangium darangshiense TaxID=579108 RepID=UPI0031EA190D
MRSDRAALWRMAGFGAAALLFSCLVVAVRVRWVPMESLDRGVADELNAVVAPRRFLVGWGNARPRAGAAESAPGRLWALAGLGVAWVLAFGALVAIGVPLARYRHPTDILGSGVLTVLWVTAAWWLLRPNRDLTTRTVTELQDE